MNAPTPFPLPPLAPFSPPGSAVPAVSLASLGLSKSALSRDLPDFGFPSDEPLAYPCDPSPLQDARLCLVVPAVAEALGLTAQAIQGSTSWQALLSGHATVENRPAYASVYAGHQFGSFVPRLGDGRALNLAAIHGQVLQLKGAGSTPYARFADGRAVLRSSVRELLCSEAMAGLGVPTTRALSLVASSTAVFREKPEPAAVVCRIAPSFVRFGHFEYFAARGRPDLMARLLDQLIDQQPAFEDLRGLGSSDRMLAFFDLTLARTASLMAHWTAVGFMHGVMNTDNFSALGLTLDYGPFAFMEAFNPHEVCNHSDHSGRYRFSHQPSVGLWNLERLLAALGTAPVLSASDRESTRDALLAQYEQHFQSCYRRLMADKLGVSAQLPATDWDRVIGAVYALMAAEGLDYAGFFRALARCDPTLPADTGLAPIRDLVLDPARFQAWQAAYAPFAAAHAQAQGLPTWQRQRARANPQFILRNWVAEEVIRALEDEGDSEPLHAAARYVSQPFEQFPSEPRWARWTGTAPDWAAGLSLSCSS